MATLDPTKLRLLDAAGEEFAEKGFEGATVRSILGRAGVRNVAAVNYYYGDKEQLYTQALIEAHRCEMQEPAGDEDAAGTPADRLRRNIRHFLTNVLALDRDPGWHNTLMIRELIRPTSASETLARDVIRPKYERLRGILGEICPEADERRLHVLAFSVVGQCLHYRLARPISQRLMGADYAALDVDYLTDHIAGFTLAALGQAPPLGVAGVPAATGADGQGGGGR